MTEEGENNFAGLFISHEENKKGEIGLISGEIPDWIKGTYGQVGPGKWDLEKCTMNYWQCGYSIVSTFEIKDSSVIFQKAFLQSNSYKKAMENGTPIAMEFGTPGIPEKIKPMLQMKLANLNPKNATDNCITCIYTLGKDTYIAGESCFFHKYDLKQHNKIGDKLSTLKTYGVISVTPHPLTDANGDQYNVGFRTFPKLNYCVIKTPGALNSTKSAQDLMSGTTVIAEIPTRWSLNMSGMHSFGMSQNHIVLIEQPLLPNVIKGAHNFSHGLPINKCIDWFPERKNRFYVVAKSTGKVLETKLKSNDAFVFTHVVNCFEQEDHIIIDVNCYPNPDFMDFGHLQTVRGNIQTEFQLSTVQRFIIPLGLKKIKKSTANEDENLIQLSLACRSKARAFIKGKSLTLCPEIIIDSCLEHFALNPNHQSKPYKFFYGLPSSLTKNQKYRNAVVKKNIESGQEFIWQGESHQFPNQPIFLPKPNAEIGELQEDDGILIFSVSSSNSNEQNMLVFLDIKSFEEIGRANFTTRVPFAMHSIFIH